MAFVENGLTNYPHHRIEVILGAVERVAGILERVLQIEDHFHTGEIHAEVACQSQDHLQFLDFILTV